MVPDVLSNLESALKSVYVRNENDDLENEEYLDLSAPEGSSYEANGPDSTGDEGQADNSDEGQADNVRIIYSAEGKPLPDEQHYHIEYAVVPQKSLTTKLDIWLDDKKDDDYVRMHNCIKVDSDFLLCDEIEHYIGG